MDGLAASTYRRFGAVNRQIRQPELGHAIFSQLGQRLAGCGGPCPHRALFAGSDGGEVAAGPTESGEEATSGGAERPQTGRTATPDSETVRYGVVGW